MGLGVMDIKKYFGNAGSGRPVGGCSKKTILYKFSHRGLAGLGIRLRDFYSLLRYPEAHFICPDCIRSTNHRLGYSAHRWSLSLENTVNSIIVVAA